MSDLREAVCNELIAWAAGEPTGIGGETRRGHEVVCVFCNMPMRWTRDQVGIKHKPNCLHLRARALRGDRDQ